MAARKRDAKGHFISEGPKQPPKASPPAKPAVQDKPHENPNVGLVMGNKGAQGHK